MAKEPVKERAKFTGYKMYEIDRVRVRRIARKLKISQGAAVRTSIKVFEEKI